MDWEKWRNEENERQQDMKAARELMKMLGIADRTPAQFWFHMVTTASIIIVGLAVVFVGMPWIIEQYRNYPTLWVTAIAPFKCHPLEYLLAPMIIAVLTFLFVIRK